MARYSRFGAGTQILLLLLLIAVLTIVGLAWFDALGLINARDSVNNLLGRATGEEPTTIENPDDLMLLDRLRLGERIEAVEMSAAELASAALALEEERAELAALTLELEQREADLIEREETLNQRLAAYDNRRAVLVQNSRDLTSMRPDAAVAILAGYDDQLLIETLRVTEELAQEAGQISFVPLWLSLLPPERTAEIQRKMTLRPAE